MDFMDSKEFEEWFIAKNNGIKQTDELLKLLVGKTIQSIKIQHSGTEYYSQINIQTTDDATICLKTCYGDNDYFTDFRCYKI